MDRNEGFPFLATRVFANLRASSGLSETRRSLAANKVKGSESEKTRNGVLWRMRGRRTAAGVAHARCLPCMRTHFVLSCLILRAKVVRCFCREGEGELACCRTPVSCLCRASQGWRCLCLSDGDERSSGICEYCGLICH
jgi:hypothetical protein